LIAGSRVPLSLIAGGLFREAVGCSTPYSSRDCRESAHSIVS